MAKWSKGIIGYVRITFWKYVYKFELENKNNIMVDDWHSVK